VSFCSYACESAFAKVAAGSRRVLIIGNGKSRKGIDYSNFDGLKIGCNKNENCDITVCVDEKMKTPRRVYLPNEKFSGAAALQVGLRCNPEEVYLLGFDFCTYSTQGSNIYGATEGYFAGGPRRWVTEEWRKELEKIALEFPQITITRLVDAQYSEEISLKSVKTLKLSAFFT
jgi:hypothetical protein